MHASYRLRCLKTFAMKHSQTDSWGGQQRLQRDLRPRTALDFPLFDPPWTRLGDWADALAIAPPSEGNRMLFRFDWIVVALVIQHLRLSGCFTYLSRVRMILSSGRM